MAASTVLPPPTYAGVEQRARPWREWTDRVLGSDPGLNRLRTALRVVVGMAAVIGAEWLFVSLTGALQVTPHAGLPAAAATARNHDVVVIAMLLGASPSIVTGIGVNDETLAGQVLSLAFIAVPLTAALALGLALAPYRPIALASFAVLLGGAGWARRFGPRGANSAVLLFLGDFIGFFLHGKFFLGDMGWLAAIVGVAVVTLIIVRVALFRPNPGRALRRTQRSYVGRAQRVADLADAVFRGGGHRAARRLQRQLVRLNEAALMIDALLGDRAVAATGSVAQQLHARLFDTELALTNVARFAEALATVDLPPAARAAVGRALAGIRAGDLAGARAAANDLIGHLRTPAPGPAPPASDRAVVIPHRFARSVVDYCDALTEWLHLGEQRASGHDDVPYEPAVTLRGGWLPGSAEVSAEASTTAGPSRGERFTLPVNVRIGLQMGAAVGLAVVAGDALDARRFYWAVLAAFISFVGVNHAIEQIRKAAFRVFGTLIGIVLGSLLVRVVGHRTGLSLAVILVFIFAGVYLLRVNYTFLCIAITVIVAQLYVQLGEFTNRLLLLRLTETAVGAGAAIVAIAVVFPLRPRRVLTVAVADQLEAVRALAADAAAQLVDPDAVRPLHHDARVVDSAYQAVLSVAGPLRASLVGEVSERVGAVVAAAAGARNYARNLVADIHSAGTAPAPVRADVERAAAVLDASIQVLLRAGRNQAGGPYVRSASLFDAVQRRLADYEQSSPTAAQLVMRDFQLLDGALARLAHVVGVPVASLDTDGPPAAGGRTAAPARTGETG